MIITHCVKFCHELWQFPKLLQIMLKSIINYGRYNKLRRYYKLRRKKAFRQLNAICRLQSYINQKMINSFVY